MLYIEWEYEGETYSGRFDLAEPLVIGRREEHDISIPDERVSRSHGALFWREGDLWLVNLSQRNGILVYQDDTAYNLPPEAEMPLHPGTVFDISHVRFKVDQG